MSVLSDPAAHDRVRAVAWRDGALELLDQRLLPAREQRLRFDDAAAVARAIRDMIVRGAPAIGIAAAYGVVLAARARFAADGEAWTQTIAADLERLADARPTAVNLFWAIARMRRRIDALPAGVDPLPALLAEADAILAEDIAANRRMGELGAALIEPGRALLTHCNTGS
ncbi:MAG TPA: S-methyl-5-thioribose-1-phosphate isomerase, partial [Plasticicumulans sp.]|nr:S-methyl-5-thioribose-1-phosphate isomerase [Plasticicumulans sp.]